MIFYSDKNVYEAAKDRIRYIFREYKDYPICVSFSGGKDSTVVLNLVHELMPELGIKKIPVMFLDQEIESPQVVDYMREIMTQPWVEPLWVQTYFKKWNASAGEWFNAWGPGEEWIREKEPYSLKECKELYGTDENSVNSYNAALRSIFGDKFVTLAGVRIEESPMRRQGLLYNEKIKGITWVSLDGKDAFRFEPIYDWTTNDVWKYIFSNHVKYCKIYNYFFTQKSIRDMRVAAFLNQQSIKNIDELKEIAPQYYAKLLKRVKGINTTVQSFDMLIDYINQVGKPKYFSTWHEYCLYLADHLMSDNDGRQKLVKIYESKRKQYLKECGKCEAARTFVENTLGLSMAVCVIREDILGKAMNNKCLGEIKNYLYAHREEIERANSIGTEEQ